MHSGRYYAEAADVDRDAGVIIAPGEIVKNKHPHKIVLEGELKAIIERALKPRLERQGIRVPLRVRVSSEWTTDFRSSKALGLGMCCGRIDEAETRQGRKSGDEAGGLKT